MAFSIIDNHIVIFNRDEEKYIDFKADTYKYYFDCFLCMRCLIGV